ncbi:hypothetical protein PFISCL1PPCAC_21946, partial [Pristionchus fissidentatus]
VLLVVALCSVTFIDALKVRLDHNVMCMKADGSRIQMNDVPIHIHFNGKIGYTRMAANGHISNDEINDSRISGEVILQYEFSCDPNIGKSDLCPGIKHLCAGATQGTKLFNIGYKESNFIGLHGGFCSVDGPNNMGCDVMAKANVPSGPVASGNNRPISIEQSSVSGGSSPPATGDTANQPPDGAVSAAHADAPVAALTLVAPLLMAAF